MRDSFVLSFRDTDLWIGNFDGLREDRALAQKLAQKLERELAVLARPSAPSLAVFNFYGTPISGALAADIAARLAGAHLRKAAFQGLDWASKRRLKKELDRLAPVTERAFFRDFQRAKEWLAGGV